MRIKSVTNAKICSLQSTGCKKGVCPLSSRNALFPDRRPPNAHVVAVENLPKTSVFRSILHGKRKEIRAKRVEF
jgi:hypothetical protein